MTSRGPAWDERSAFGASRGIPWWGAVLVAFGLSLVGAVLDEKITGGIATVFDAAYVIGSVAAVCLVRRRSLFCPMVQPPLILVVTLLPVVDLTSKVTSGKKLIDLGIPLVNAFPVMAITTGATVVIGVIRFLLQRRPASERGRGNADVPRRRPADRDRDRDDRGRTPRRDRDEFDRRQSGARGSQPSSGSRGGPDRAGQGRAGQDRAGQDRLGQDRATPRDRPRVDPGRGRGPAADDRGRGAGPAGGRDRQPSRGRVPREDPRRQPRRRDDDDGYYS